MIASLPMYARPELEDAHDRYWQAIRRELRLVDVASPRHLSQDVAESAPWLDPTLVLSQTCGQPYRTYLHGRVTLVGTPDFGVDGCPPGHYRSALVVRAADPRVRVAAFADDVFAYNSDGSQSGYTAAWHHTGSLGFWFTRRLHTGAHVESSRAVADGRAAIAAIDAVSWRLIEAHEPFADRLRVLEWTSPTPGLPYISSADADGPALFGAVARAIDTLDEADREALGLLGLVRIPTEAYLAIENAPATGV